ncbi:hypothetical protein ATCC90586_010196 [Pythium insidiosum]|nr:hypothetical protein ATCC90586_010196 [Pythium insidiosum]
MARFGMWSEAERCRNLELYLRGAAEAWYQQLGTARRSLSTLAAAFTKEFCTSRQSEAERYFTLKQRKGETPREHLWRLNAAARKARIPISTPDDLRHHVSRFIKSLADSDIWVALIGRPFRTLEELERALRAMMSLDLARQLGLKLRFDERLRVKGIGNVTTYVSAKATVKITLGASVVYYLEIWCGNIGEGIQCLLGMDFMIAAGVRLGAREAPRSMGPVLGRSSYIDDIASKSETWDGMCKTLDNLLYRLRYWRISVNLNKSKSAFGKRSIDHLSHEINREGIRATPKSAKSLSELAFPVTLKGMQSFLGSLNYYGKFIEGYASIASVLYELTDEQLRAGHDLEKAKLAFQLLKDRRAGYPVVSIEMLDAEYDGYVVTFDGAAKLKTKRTQMAIRQR